MKGMQLNRFVQRDKASPIHSSGFVQSGQRMGSTSASPFAKRVQQDRSRQMVGGYRDAQVLRQARAENRGNRPVSHRDSSASLESSGQADELQMREQRRGSRIDVVRPSPSNGNSPAPPSRPSVAQHSFREPPSRYHP